MNSHSQLGTTNHGDECSQTLTNVMKSGLHCSLFWPRPAYLVDIRGGK